MAEERDHVRRHTSCRRNAGVVAERALEQGRGAYANRPWADAFEAPSHANHEKPLGAEELELLARAAYMLGLDDEYRKALEQGHHAFREGAGAWRAAGS